MQVYSKAVERMRAIVYLSFALAILCTIHAVLPCLGATLSGCVVKVADGDTITVLDAAKAQRRIRPNAIDAPEKSQTFGQKPKERLYTTEVRRRRLGLWRDSAPVPSWEFRKTNKRRAAPTSGAANGIIQGEKQ